MPAKFICTGTKRALLEKVCENVNILPRAYPQRSAETREERQTRRTSGWGCDTEQAVAWEDLNRGGERAVRNSLSDGWVAKFIQVSRPLATAALWVCIQTSLKNHK